MNIKDILKNKFFWFSIILLVTVIVIIVSVRTSGDSPPSVCPTNKVLHHCDGSPVCEDPCPSGKTWDCVSKSCECPVGTISCVGNTICCDQCVNDLCCSTNNQITVDGKTQCCSPGTGPDSTGKVCLSYCGEGAKVCEKNQECMKLTNLDKTTFDTLTSTYSKDSNWAGSTWDSTNNKGYIDLCVDSNSCTWEDPTGIPSSIGDAWTYYNFSGLSDTGSLCLPTTVKTDQNCYSAKNETDCQKASEGSCKWTNILDDYSNPETSDILKNNLTKWIENKNQSTLGYYCGDTSTTPYGRLQQVIGSNLCKWSDCYQQISNTGTIKVQWDENSKRCSALKGTGTAGGISSLTKCMDKGNPCSACNTPGEYVNCGGASKSNWKFDKCITTNNDMVLSQNNSNGNCPWGCNPPIESIDCRNTVKVGDQNLVIGQKFKNNTDIYCTGDGQISTWDSSPEVWSCGHPDVVGCVNKKPVNPTDPSYSSENACIDDCPAPILVGDEIYIEVTRSNDQTQKWVVNNANTTKKGQHVTVQDMTTINPPLTPLSAATRNEFKLIIQATATKDKNSPFAEKGSIIDTKTMYAMLQQSDGSNYYFGIDKTDNFLYEPVGKNIFSEIYNKSIVSNSILYYNTTYINTFDVGKNQQLYANGFDLSLGGTITFRKIRHS